jgi:hypothetical protein
MTIYAQVDPLLNLLFKMSLKTQLHWRTSVQMSAEPPADQVIFPSGLDGPLLEV